MSWYQILDKDIPKSKNHVVYKIWYAEKYVIIAGKTLVRSVENINISLHRFFKDTAMGRNPNDMYYNFYCHVDEYPIQEFSIEIVIDTESHYEYLKAWHLELLKGQDDPNCLNLYFEPYIPKSTQRKKGSWLNRGCYLNYMKWAKHIKNSMLV